MNIYYQIAFLMMPTPLKNIITQIMDMLLVICCYLEKFTFLFQLEDSKTPRGTRLCDS